LLDFIDLRTFLSQVVRFGIAPAATFFYELRDQFDPPRAFAQNIDDLDNDWDQNEPDSFFRDGNV
jgi:hypothetical protein